ncbi:uncharacterized protein [Nicotiana sylvestris]|uniref:uncharacterized protein isoform X6 n=1 Tax=Nicotiana sylvestris TaxID=4096 RepID=UPI00388C3B34
MLGISYGELFLLLGATAALIGPKDLPIIARTAGRFAGRSIGYVQLARGQFESVMQQSQARQVHKELQDTIAQLEAIRHEIRTISFMNPGPMTSRLVDSTNTAAANNAENTIDEKGPQISEKENILATITPEVLLFLSLLFSLSFASFSNGKIYVINNYQDYSSRKPLTDMHSQAAAYARLAETTPLKSISIDKECLSELTDDSGSIIVLPVSAESAGLLPKRKVKWMI